ncbi:MAG: hypothetical protein ABIN93_19015 [Ginsengibacter sp.]
MKKTLLSVLLFLFITALCAQDIKKVKSFVDKKDFEKAKTEIDAFLEKNPTNAQGWYYKSVIYGNLASSEQFKSMNPDGRTVAFEAFKKAMDNSKDNKELMVMMVTDKDFYKPVLDLYTGYFDAAVATYGSGITTKNKEDFTKSMNLFISADSVGKYIYTNKWYVIPEIDTLLILDIGKAAINGGNQEQALLYFKKIADAGIFRTKEDSTGYSLAYQWLALHYRDAEDEANFLKYASLGKQNFPKDDYFEALMLDHYRSKKDYDALFKGYSEVVAKYPDSLLYHVNYATELFNYVYNSDAGTKINNREEILKTVYKELEKAITLKPDYVTTNWLYGQYYFNAGIDVKEKIKDIKGAKPEDIKAKADLNAQAKEFFTMAIPYAEKALAGFEEGYKKTERSKYKSVTDLMQRIYTSLNQADKVKVYETKYDTADTKFVN